MFPDIPLAFSEDLMQEYWSAWAERVEKNRSAPKTSAVTHPYENAKNSFLVPRFELILHPPSASCVGFL